MSRGGLKTFRERVPKTADPISTRKNETGAARNPRVQDGDQHLAQDEYEMQPSASKRVPAIDNFT